MENYYKKKKESLLELLDQVKNGDSVRLLKTKQCILDFEPVLNKLHHTVHQPNVDCMRKEILDMPCGAPNMAIYTKLRWDYFLERLVVVRSVYIETFDEDENEESYEREFVVTHDFIADMSERQLHHIYPLCEILIKKVIRSIESALIDLLIQRGKNVQKV